MKNSSNTLGFAFDQFLMYLRHECGLADNSVEAYRRDLSRFYLWMDQAGLKHWSTITVTKLGEYLEFLNAEDLAPTSVARHVASLKMFFRFLVLDGHLEKSVADLLYRPSLWERIPFVLSEPQAQSLLEAPGPNDRLVDRDRALLAMMYATGTRASEVADLKVEHVNLDKRFARCTGKGNKERIVPFSESARDKLKLYLEGVRPWLLGPRQDHGHVFVTRAGRPIDRVDLWKIVKKYAARLGLADRVSPHTLRHSFATHMLAHGADLRVIQELLGHANISTTQHYTRVDATRLLSVHQQFHPRG